MTDQSSAPARRRCPRWLWILLVVSVSLNLVAVGMIGGRYLRKMDRDPELGRWQARIVRMLPEERQAMGREIMLGRKAELGEIRNSLMASNRQVWAALRADPFEPAAFQAALDARRAAMAQRFGLLHMQMVEITEKLTASERAEIAEKMEERSKRWMRRIGGQRRE